MTWTTDTRHLQAVPEPTGRQHRCGCGRVYDRVWWIPPERHARRGIRPRWVLPKLDPCEGCHAEESVQRLRTEAAELEQRQKRAGLYDRDRGWRLEHLRFQARGESWEDFRSFLRQHPGHIGVHDGNRTAIEMLTTWQPSNGWLYIEGEPGSGKTVLAAALVSRLIQGGGERWEWQDDTEDEGTWHEVPSGFSLGELATQGARLRMVRRPVLGGVLMVTDDELKERCRLAWSGDRDPLLQVEEAKVLVIDDLGTEGWETHKDNVRRLIAARYRDNLATIITSNVAWTALEKTYGRRVSSRLKEMVPVRNRITLRRDWRAS